MKKNQFSRELLDSAAILMVNAVTEAIRISGGDFAAADQLLFERCQRDPKVRDAFLRGTLIGATLRIIEGCAKTFPEDFQAGIARGGVWWPPTLSSTESKG